MFMRGTKVNLLIKMKKIYSDSQLQECYEKGYDSVVNGANTINCNFELFSSPKKRKAWEEGERNAKKDNKK